jgi:hypothetical protein
MCIKSEVIWIWLVEGLDLLDSVYLQVTRKGELIRTTTYYQAEFDGSVGIWITYL